MKKTLIVILIVFLLTTPAFAQQQNFGVHVTQFLNSIASMIYEQKVGPDGSFTVEGAFWTPNWHDFDVSCFSLGASYRFYPEGNAIQGAYASPSIFTAWAGGNYLGSPITIGSIGLAGSGGYQWIFSNNLSVDVSVMLTMPLFTMTVGEQEPNRRVFKQQTHLKVGIGYAW